MKNFVIASLGSLTLAGAALAAPTGLYWESSTVVDGTGNEWCVGRLYLCFDNPADTLLNVFNANIGINGGQFNHNDTSTAGANAAVGSWSANSFFPPVFGNPAIDSFVTIGGTTSTVVANANTTNFDPSFNGGAGSGISGGWFNGNPPNLQGKSTELPGQSGWYTLLGQFVTSGGAGKSLSVTLKQTSNQGLGTPSYPQTEFSGLFDFCGPVPAPGALALLGLAGLAGGRRRRA